MAAWRYEISLLVLKNISLVRAAMQYPLFIIWPKRELSLEGPSREIPSEQDGPIRTQNSPHLAAAESAIINLPTETATSYFMNQR